MPSRRGVAQAQALKAEIVLLVAAEGGRGTELRLAREAQVSPSTPHRMRIDHSKTGLNLATACSLLDVLGYELTIQRKDATVRAKLPQRREMTVVDVVHPMDGGSQPVIASIGFFEDGRPAEVFLDTPKTTPMAYLARDTALLISIALQHGASVEEMRSAVGRSEEGVPHTLAGSALDALAAVQP